MYAICVRLCTCVCLPCILVCTSLSAHLDYSPGPFSVTFEQGDTTACVEIAIVNDVIFEEPQSFLITIQVPEGVRARAENTATVTILDDDGETLLK